MKIVKEGSKVKVEYLGKIVVQEKVVLTKDYTDLVRKNKAILKELEERHLKEPKKELKEQIREFEKNNPLKFNFEEVTPDSPIGLALLKRELNDICVMTLPLTQGGESLIKILEIQ